MSPAEVSTSPLPSMLQPQWLTAIAVCCHLGRNPGAYVGGAELVRITGAPSHRIEEVTRQLATADLLLVRRGRHGGYRLTREPQRMTLLEVVLAVPAAVTRATTRSLDARVAEHLAAMVSGALAATLGQITVASVTHSLRD
jgi:DNA-binding IscR family transcriptional regulator